MHSGQFSNLGWELRTLGPISWFHFCCSQNPSPSSSTQWTEDLGGSILFFSLKPATRSRKHQAPLYGFQQVHTVHLQATQPGKWNFAGWYLLAMKTFLFVNGAVTMQDEWSEYDNKLMCELFSKEIHHHRWRSVKKITSYTWMTKRQESKPNFLSSLSKYL